MLFCKVTHVQIHLLLTTLIFESTCKIVSWLTTLIAPTFKTTGKTISSLTTLVIVTAWKTISSLTTVTKLIFETTLKIVLLLIALILSRHWLRWFHHWLSWYSRVCEKYSSLITLTTHITITYRGIFIRKFSVVIHASLDIKTIDEDLS